MPSGSLFLSSDNKIKVFFVLTEKSPSIKTSQKKMPLSKGLNEFQLKEVSMRFQIYFVLKTAPLCLRTVTSRKAKLTKSTSDCISRKEILSHLLLLYVQSSLKCIFSCSLNMSIQMLSAVIRSKILSLVYFS